MNPHHIMSLSDPSRPAPTSLDLLPTEIQVQILESVNKIDHHCLRRVCTLWNSILTQIISKHDHEPYEIIEYNYKGVLPSGYRIHHVFASTFKAFALAEGREGDEGKVVGLKYSYESNDRPKDAEREEKTIPDVASTSKKKKERTLEGAQALAPCSEPTHTVTSASIATTPPNPFAIAFTGIASIVTTTVSITPPATPKWRPMTPLKRHASDISTDFRSTPPSGLKCSTKSPTPAPSAHAQNSSPIPIRSRLHTTLLTLPNFTPYDSIPFSLPPVTRIVAFIRTHTSTSECVYPVTVDHRRHRDRFVTVGDIFAIWGNHLAKDRRKEHERLLMRENVGEDDGDRYGDRERVEWLTFQPSVRKETEDMERHLGREGRGFGLVDFYFYNEMQQT